MKKLLFLVVVLTGFLTGCGTTQAATGQTTTYQHDLGTATIPRDPKRIVADYYVGELLMLDAKLVAADLTYTSTAWKDQLAAKNITNISQSTETIIANQPDLIITFSPSKYESYQQIAPTVYIPYEKYNPEQLVTELGKITNTSGKATTWINEFNEQITKLKNITKPELTYSLMEVFGSDAYVYGASWGRGGYILYDKLKLKPSPMGQSELLAKKQGYIIMNAESVAGFAGEVMFMINPDQNPQAQEFIKKPNFTTLPAVKNQKLFYLDPGYFWFNDPLSLALQIQHFTEVFTNEL